MEQEQRQPRNIFEQLAFGLQTVNDNIIDLYKMVSEIHKALYPEDFNNNNKEGSDNIVKEQL